MAKPWLAACYIYVLFKRDQLPALVGKLEFGKYDNFFDFRTAVADVVEMDGSFREYKRCQLVSGVFFKLTHPAKGNHRPARPKGNGLMPSSVELSPGDCILLDISASEFRFHFVPRAFLPCVAPPCRHFAQRLVAISPSPLSYPPPSHTPITPTPDSRR